MPDYDYYEENKVVRYDESAWNESKRAAQQVKDALSANELEEAQEKLRLFFETHGAALNVPGLGMLRRELRDNYLDQPLNDESARQLASELDELMDKSEDVAAKLASLSY